MKSNSTRYRHNSELFAYLVLFFQGEVFLVKDLFKGYVWNRIPRKDRLLLGTLFLNYVNKMEDNIKAIEKTSPNQQRYQKV